MRKQTDSQATETLALLENWLKAVHDVVQHIGITRGPHAPYYCIRQSPWPLEATHVVCRDTSRVIEYLKKRHALGVRGPLERIADAAKIWTDKRAAVEAFGKTKHANGEFPAAARELEQCTETGLPEQKRLNLDLRIAVGAVWRPRFPLLAERFGKERPFLIRSSLVRWALWVQEAFADAIRDWPLPDERDIFGQANEGNDVCGVGLESQERWELAGVVLPRVIPNTDETPIKLTIEEARRVGDLPVALPVIKRLDDEIEAFVIEAVRWPQGNLQPARTEHFFHAVNELEQLVGSERGPNGEEAGSVDKATLAMAILFKNPEISPTKLAQEVGVSRGTLYSKSKKWIDVRRTLRARNTGEALRGSKSADGRLDAAAEHREFDPTDDE